MCAAGLHVGTLSCAREFAFGRLNWLHVPMVIVKCLVMPEDVVCVPNQALFNRVSGSDFVKPSHQKIRCKKLQVLEEYMGANFIAAG
jgi:hypothetical protein